MLNEKMLQSFLFSSLPRFQQHLVIKVHMKMKIGKCLGLVVPYFPYKDNKMRNESLFYKIYISFQNELIEVESLVASWK